MSNVAKQGSINKKNKLIQEILTDYTKLKINKNLTSKGKTPLAISVPTEDHIARVKRILDAMDIDMAEKLVPWLNKNTEEHLPSNAYGDRNFGYIDFKLDVLRVMNLFPKFDDPNDNAYLYVQRILVGHQTTSENIQPIINYLEALPKNVETRLCLVCIWHSLQILWPLTTMMRKMLSV